MIEHSKFKEKYDYDPLTGEFTWKSDNRGLKGKPAGYLNTKLNRIYVSSGDSHQIPIGRAIWYWMTGVDPIDYYIGYKNGNTLDNRWDNLTKRNQKEQSIAARLNFMEKRGTKRVGDKWIAYINKNYETIQLGEFDTQEEAKQSYKDALAKYRKKYRWLADKGINKNG